MPDSHASKVKIQQNPQAALQSVLGVLHSGDAGKAMALCKNSVIAAPHYADGWLLLSQLQFDYGRTDRAQQCAERALGLAPANKRASLLLARSLIANNQTQKALQLLDELDSRSQDDALFLRLLADLYASLLYYDRAQQSFARVVELEPEDPDAWHLYSGALFALGRLDEAKIAVGKVLELDPVHGEALLTRSSMSKQSPTENHVDELESLLKNAHLPPEDRIRLNFSLAKELEDLERYPQSFHYLTQGADQKDKQLGYDPGRDVEFMSLSTTRIAEAISEKCRDESLGEGIIFIVSLPRSGSTLIDRILSSHSGVTSAGETDVFHKLLVKHARTACAGKKMTFVDSICQIDYRALGRDYMAMYGNRASPSHMLIDKTPLPRAKLIHVYKSPMDACYSIYKTLFSRGYGYSYDLDKLGQFYIAYNAMMLEYSKQIRGEVCDIRYEDLLANQEHMSQKLLDFCDLDWQQQCMDFHLNENPTATASVVQVRQPLFQTSKKKWLCYRTQLAPLADKLVNAGIEIEVDDV